jgi:hypothetical protein
MRQETRIKALRKLLRLSNRFLSNSEYQELKQAVMSGEIQVVSARRSDNRDNDPTLVESLMKEDTYWKYAEARITLYTSSKLSEFSIKLEILKWDYNGSLVPDISVLLISPVKHLTIFDSMLSEELDVLAESAYEKMLLEQKEDFKHKFIKEYLS